MRSTLTRLLNRLLCKDARIESYLFVSVHHKTVSALQRRHTLRPSGSLRSTAKCFAIVLLVAGTLPFAFSQDAADAAWSGQWKLDRTASHFFGVAVKIQHHRTGIASILEVRPSPSGTMARTTQRRRRDPRALFKPISTIWLRVHKMNGKTLDTSIFTMADDEQSFLIHTIAVDEKGEKHESDEKFLRESPGEGIDGTWRSTKAGVNAAESIKIASLQDHRLRIDFPDQQMFFVTPLDGSAVSYGGARAVPNVQIAVSKSSPRRCTGPTC